MINSASISVMKCATENSQLPPSKQAKHPAPVIWNGENPLGMNTDTPLNPVLPLMPLHKQPNTIGIGEEGNSPSTPSSTQRNPSGFPLKLKTPWHRGPPIAISPHKSPIVMAAHLKKRIKAHNIWHFFARHKTSIQCTPCA
jgi:hypothetical protein